jgi:membrane protein implicated in regulation of membrane protease activity
MMDAYVWWAVIGIGLIIVEMMTGTVFLLVLGLAALVGALVAWVGAGFWAQALAAAASAAVGMLAASHLKKNSPQAPGGNSLDVGHTVILDAWVSEADGIAKVRYRNALWDARVSGAHTPGTTMFYIRATEGSTLHISSERP